jgi:hypothetical protein
LNRITTPELDKGVAGRTLTPVHTVRAGSTAAAVEAEPNLRRDV